jgi:hypothetical protein
MYHPVSVPTGGDPFTTTSLGIAFLSSGHEAANTVNQGQAIPRESHDTGPLFVNLDVCAVHKRFSCNRLEMLYACGAQLAVVGVAQILVFFWTTLEEATPKV